MGGRKKGGRGHPVQDKVKQLGRQVKQELKKEKEILEHAHGKKGRKDAWKKESQRFQEQVSSIGFTLKEIPGDGNCLFRAIGDQLENDSSRHEYYRARIVDYIKTHRSDFEPFIIDLKFEAYCEKMGDKGTWGGNVELQAASLALEINITVHQLDQPRWQIINFPGTDLLGSDVKMIHLSYHDGQHYNSLIPNNPHLVSTVSTPAKSSSSSSSSKPTNSRKTTKSGINMTQEENMVSIAMKSSNFMNREMVIGVLRDYDYDLDSTIEALICMKNLDNESNHDNNVDYHSSSSPFSPSSTNGTTSITSTNFPSIAPPIPDTSSYSFLSPTPATTTNGMAIPPLSSLPASISDIIHAELTTLMSQVSNYSLPPSTSLDGSGFICPPMNDDEALAASLYESEILAASLASLGKQTSPCSSFSSSSSSHPQKGQEKVPVQEKTKYQGNCKTKNKNQPQKHLSNKQRKELRKQEQSGDQRKEMKRLEIQQLLEQVRQEEGEEVAQRLAVDLGAMMI